MHGHVYNKVMQKGANNVCSLIMKKKNVLAVIVVLLTTLFLIIKFATFNHFILTMFCVWYSGLLQYTCCVQCSGFFASAKKFVHKNISSICEQSTCLVPIENLWHHKKGVLDTM